MSKDKLAGVIVLYNPDEKVFSNIDKYIEALDFVILYDNSSDNTKYIEIIKSLQSDKVIYEYNSENEGISIALNQSMKIAKQQGCNYLLTMDQDSEFDKNDVIELYKVMQIKRVAIVAPKVLFINSKQNKIKKTTTDKISSIDFVITSGNIIDIEAIIDLGSYDEKIFIDGVDRELCLRIKREKKEIIQCNDISLFQQLGDGEINLLNVSPHSAIRNYYIARNRRYIVNSYPEFFHGFNWLKSVYLSEIKQILSIVLFETEKLNKIKMVRYGIKHQKNMKGGRYDE